MNAPFTFIPSTRARPDNAGDPEAVPLLACVMIMLAQRDARLSKRLSSILRYHERAVGWFNQRMPSCDLPFQAFDKGIKRPAVKGRRPDYFRVQAGAALQHLLALRFDERLTEARNFLKDLRGVADRQLATEFLRKTNCLDYIRHDEWTYWHYINEERSFSAVLADTGLAAFLQQDFEDQPRARLKTFVAAAKELLA